MTKTIVGGLATLLLDTHVLVWIGEGNAKLSAAALAAIRDAGTSLLVSAVTAWEYVELHRRERLPGTADFTEIMTKLHAQVVDLPAEVWTVAAALPDIHRDPTDRQVIAHAILADLTLITADADMRRYPVRTLW